MIINNFTKTETHPLRSIEPESVGVLWLHFDADENQKNFLKRKEEDSLFAFDNQGERWWGQAPFNIENLT